MLGKGNQGMKSRVATDRIRPMAPPPLHSMCEHSPPIESVVLGKQRARHFPSADFKDDNYWTSGNRVQTIAPTLSISHTWCRPNQRGRTLHKQSRGLWSLLAGWVLQEVCEWNRLAGSQSTCFATSRKRTRYIFSHFRQFLRRSPSWPNHTICQTWSTIGALLLSSSLSTTTRDITRSTWINICQNISSKSFCKI